MHIHTYSLSCFLLFVVKCHGCIPTLPWEEVGFVERLVDQLEDIPEPPLLKPAVKVFPVFKVLKKEFEQTNRKLISKTAKVSVTNKPLKEFTAIFAGCHLNQIKSPSPEIGKQQGKTIIPPDLSCTKKSLLGCDTATLKCNVPNGSKYPLISGFAKIDGADWATTDLKANQAVFQLECDIYNRWTYVSDISGLEGKVYTTNEVSCLLVPIITESNSLDFEQLDANNPDDFLAEPYP